jgi:hypothetical protein
MADEPSGRPGGTPHVPGRVVAGLRQAMDDPASRPGAFIRLTVSGGVAGERYELVHLVDASGATTSHLRDQMTSRESRYVPDLAEEDDPARFRSLAEAIDVESLLQTEHPTGGFPPDSLVGILEVSDGEQTETFTFLADDAQAERAGVVRPGPLRQAVDAVYAAAAEAMGEQDLKP